MAKYSARDTAVQAIEATSRGIPLQAALVGALKAHPLDLRDTQFCGDLVYGYWRNRERINFLLGTVLQKPRKLPAEMLAVLGVAVYSLCFQENVPSYAAIDAAVRRIKIRFGLSLSKVANGALRRLAANLPQINEKSWWLSRGLDEWTANSLFYSIPLSIANLWKNAYGETNARKLIRRSQRRPWSAVRLNPAHPDIRRLEQVCLDCGKSQRISQNGFAFPPGELPAEFKSAGADSAAFSFQSAASMLILDKLGLAEWRGPVWDCCAGVGGKTCALLEMGVEVLLATDPSPRRLRQLRTALKNHPSANIALADALQPPLAVWPGNILVDAPCSGLGVLARRPDIKVHELDLPQKQSLQRNILRSAGRHVQPGRELAYLTCTLNPLENELAIAAFLKENQDFQLIEEWQTPHDHPWLEGMYGARLRHVPA